MLGLGLPLGLRRRSVPSVRSRAVALWLTRDYDATLDALRDQSGNGMHARFGSSVGADTNDPLRLTYSGEPYVYLPGASGNLVLSDYTTVHTTLDVRARTRDITTNGQIAQQSGRWIFAYSAGTLRARFNSATSYTATTSLSTPTYVRMTYAESVNELKFYTSEDGATWDQLGATITTAITMSTDPMVLNLGHEGDAAVSLRGALYWAEVRNGINGPVVARFDAALCGQTGYTDPDLGTVWTVNRSSSGRKAVVMDGSVPAVLLLGTDDYLEVADDPRLDFGAGESFTVVAVVRRWGVAAATQTIMRKGSSVGYGLQHRTAGNGYETVFATDGTATPVANSGVDRGGTLASLALVRNVNADTVSLSVDGVSAASTIDTTTATLANNAVMRVGADTPTAGFYWEGEFVAAAIFREALSSADLARLARELGVSS